MKRVLGLLAGASLSLAMGCAQSYDIRVERTIQNMLYRRDLDNNTEAPPAKSNLETLKIYLRAPKGLKGPATQFAYAVEPGKFDATDTFIATGEKPASLHILARSNAAKAPAKKAPGPQGPEQPAPTPRGDFVADVLDFLKMTYSTEEFTAAKLKPVDPNAHGRKGVSYKGATVDLGDRQVMVRFHGDKNSPTQVALIFEGSKEALRALSSQIDYSLNSLVLGPRAAALYSGQDEVTDEDTDTAAPAAF